MTRSTRTSRRDRARGRHGRRHLVRRLVQDRPEVDGLVQQARLRRRRRGAAGHLGGAADHRADDLRLRRAAVLDRRRRRMAPVRPVREHLPAHRRARTCTTSSRSTRSRGPTSRSRTRSPNMADMIEQQRRAGRRHHRRRCRPTSTAPSTQAFTDPPEGAMIFEGELRRRRHHRRDQGEGRDRRRLLRLPIDRRVAACGDGRWRHRRPAGRHARRQGADRVPGDARGGRGLGWPRRLHLAEQERRRVGLHRRRDPTRRAGVDRRRRQRALRHVRPAAHGVRRDDRPGHLGDPHRLPAGPRRRRRAPRSSWRRRPKPPTGSDERVMATRRPPRPPSSARSRWSAVAVPLPALVLLGALVVYPIFFSVVPEPVRARRQSLRRRRQLPDDVRLGRDAGPRSRTT